MNSNYRDTSGQIGSRPQSERESYQPSFAYSDRSGSIPSMRDSIPQSQPGTSVKGGSATFRNGLIANN